MSTQLTFAELLAKATPGPYKVRELSEEFFLRTNHSRSIDSPTQIVAKIEGLGPVTDANAEITSRLLNCGHAGLAKTLRDVLDRLECANRRAVKAKQMGFCVDDVGKLITILDGKAGS